MVFITTNHSRLKHLEGIGSARKGWNVTLGVPKLSELTGTAVLLVYYNVTVTAP